MAGQTASPPIGPFGSRRPVRTSSSAAQELLEPGHDIDRHLASGAQAGAGADPVADRVAADVALYRVVVKMIVVHLDTRGMSGLPHNLQAGWVEGGAGLGAVVPQHQELGVFVGLDPCRIVYCY